MSKIQRSHPDGDRLMRYCDGELNSSETAQIRRHLEACWDCRSEIERLQRTISDCVDYRRNVLQEHLPTPPEPWKDIYTQMDRIDATLAPSIWERWWNTFRQAASPRFAIPAGAIAALVLTFVLFRDTPSVQAAELLQRAAQAERTAPKRAKRLQIRTRTASFTRLLPAAGPSPVAALFDSAKYDWQDPLSVRAYDGWRHGLAAKTDEVTEDNDSYRIRTQTDSGELREASMKLRRDDLRAVQGTFVFRNQEWVELTELEAEAVHTASAEPVPSTHRAPITEPAAAQPVEEMLPATEAEELKVWALLHKLQADLGEPVEVTRSEGKVRVSAIGLSPDRQEEITAGLSGVEKVDLRFDQPAAPGLTSPTGTGATLKPGVSPLAKEIEKHLGSRYLLEQLATDSMDHSDLLMARAYAIHRLAGRFPAQSVESMSPTESAMFEGINRDHLNVMALQAAALERLLGPTLKALGGTAAPAPAPQDLFTASRKLERSISMLFGSAELEGGARELPSRVLSNLAAVQALTRRPMLSSAPAATSRD